MNTLNISQNSRLLRLVLALAFGLVLLIGLLLAMGAARPPGVALAQGSTTCYVDCVSGSDSGDCTASPCQTIGYALSQANNGDTIRVAACTYTESLTLDKSVSLMGDGADDTFIHALNGQRVMTITGATITNSTVISGFTFTGGNPVADVGGGLLVTTSAPTIRDNYIISNTIVMTGNGGGLYFQDSNGPLLSGNLISGNSTITGYGGGLYFDNSPNVMLTGNTIRDNKANPTIDNCGGGVLFDNSSKVTLSDNTISDNRAFQVGGLYFRDSHTATLTANTISGNSAKRTGGGKKHYGGVRFQNSDNATLISNTISGNHADNECGGICFTSGSSNATLIGNNIVGNSAGSPGHGDSKSGGLGFIGSANANLIGNIISNNSTNTLGGGLYLERSDITMTNNVIMGNQITNTSNFTCSGSGLYIAGSSPRLLHTTIARNSGCDGSGVYITDIFGRSSNVALTNTILVSHTVGVTVTAGNTATLNGVLWYSNTMNYGGEGYITVTNEYTGPPAFAADGYHLTCASAAIDRGVNAGVDDDIDGDPRPLGGGYDLGADEINCIYLPIILKNSG